MVNLCNFVMNICKCLFKIVILGLLFIILFIGISVVWWNGGMIIIC